MGIEASGRTAAPAAVVFDVDGLLVETEPCWSVTETELFARPGLRFAAEQKALLLVAGRPRQNGRELDRSPSVREPVEG